VNDNASIRSLPAKAAPMRPPPRIMLTAPAGRLLSAMTESAQTLLRRIREHHPNGTKFIDGDTSKNRVGAARE
jgi:hypothetical protein